LAKDRAAASGVHRDWVKQLLPSALNKLAENIAEDPAKRPLIVTQIEVPITADPNGVWTGTINTDGICCKNSLAIQNVVVSSCSLLLWNVAKIFFATDPTQTDDDPGRVSEVVSRLTS
jgi:hypothetical protein